MSMLSQIFSQCVEIKEFQMIAMYFSILFAVSNECDSEIKD